MGTVAQTLTLEKFLQLPETKPAAEFISGEIIQKPMPQGEHSLLQGELTETINKVVKPQRIAIAFPELRCTSGDRSIVPDISVFWWERIPITSSGKIANRFEIYPDWAIEILSPEQRQTRVLENLLHCSQYGTELGWLIDPEEESILIILPEARVQLLRGNMRVPVLSRIDLDLTVKQVFDRLIL